MDGVYRATLDFGPIWALRNIDEWHVFEANGRQLATIADPSRPTTHPLGLPNVVAHRFVEHWDRCDLGVGCHRPRISHGYGSPGPKEYPREWAASHGAVGSLVRRMADVFHYVEPNKQNSTAYGHEMRQLLIIAATEVESSFRAILAVNEYVPPGGDVTRMSTNDFVRLAEPMRLREWRVALAVHPDMGELKPFDAWDPSQPTKSLAWYDAYNTVKHDREKHFDKATLGHAVSAVAAAYVMVVAQFGEFDNRHILDIDDFRQLNIPEFSAAEEYVPPTVQGGWRHWTPAPLFRT